MTISIAWAHLLATTEGATPVEPVEVPIEKIDGKNLWLPRLALIGVLATAGPCLAVVLENLPPAWVEQRPIFLGLVLTVIGVAILVATFAVARAIASRDRLSLRILGNRVELIRGQGRKVEAQADLDEVDIKQRTHVFHTGDRTSATPLLTIDVPGFQTIILTVDNDDEAMDWREPVEESDEPAAYTTGSVPWRRLLRALGMGRDIRAAEV